MAVFVRPFLGAATGDSNGAGAASRVGPWEGTGPAVPADDGGSPLVGCSVYDLGFGRHSCEGRRAFSVSYTRFRWILRSCTRSSLCSGAWRR